MTAEPPDTSTATRDTAIAVVHRLYDAYNARDVDAIMACWAPGGVEYMPLAGPLPAPDRLRRHFEEFYGAFPDSSARILKLLADDNGQVAVRMRLSGTFTGGPFAGLRANGEAWNVEMAEFFATEDGLITRLDVYMDSMELARQIRLFPRRGGLAEKSMYAIFNGIIALRRPLAAKRLRLADKEVNVVRRAVGNGLSFLESRLKSVLAVSALIVLVTLGVGAGVIPLLSGGGFDASGTESARAAAALQRDFHVGSVDAVFLVTARTGTVGDPGVAAAGQALTRRLGGDPGVESVVSYWRTPGFYGLRSTDGKQALLLVQLTGSQNAKSAWLRRAHARYDQAPGPAGIRIGGYAEVFRNIQAQIIRDLLISEAIAIPVSLILLLLVFRSVASALLPLAMGVFAAAITLFTLRILAFFTDVSIFSINMTSALSLGLGIDYGLLMVTRFREELKTGRPVYESVRRTLRTAGRTVFFSGVTVGLSLATLLLFPLSFLRSFAYAGIPSVLGAVLGALVVLPALLRLLGRNIERWPVGKLPRLSPGEETWGRIARWAPRRRVPVSVLLIAVLAALAVPFLHVQIGKDDARVLPASSPVRTVQGQLLADFPGDIAYPVDVYLPGLGDTPSGLRGQREIISDIARLPYVYSVSGAGGTWHGGRMIASLGQAGAAMERPAASYLSVLLRPDVGVYSTQARQTVTAIRNLGYPSGHPLVAGESASVIDDTHAIGVRLPWAIGLIFVLTFLLTFLLTGSVVVPLKAVFLNLLSLTAMFGLMVWIFQEGHLQNLLAFTATGYLDDAMPILMFFIAFGLSMDYELFLVSRIHEEYLISGENNLALVAGIKKTGAVFTQAALLLAVVFAGLAVSGVSLIKMAGLGMMVAILMDAIVIRSVLVPALMSVMGRANWWAPKFMRRIHRSAGLSDG